MLQDQCAPVRGCRASSIQYGFNNPLVSTRNDSMTCNDSHRLARNRTDLNRLGLEPFFPQWSAPVCLCTLSQPAATSVTTFFKRRGSGVSTMACKAQLAMCMCNMQYAMRWIAQRSKSFATTHTAPAKATTQKAWAKKCNERPLMGFNAHSARPVSHSQDFPLRCRPSSALRSTCDKKPRRSLTPMLSPSILTTSPFFKMVLNSAWLPFFW